MSQIPSLPEILLVGREIIAPLASLTSPRYVPRLIGPFPEVGFFHLIKMYTLGQVLCKFGFNHGAWVKNVLFRAYWPFLFILALVLVIPGTSGRCDKYPRIYWLDRLRYYLGECLITVWFSSGAMNSGDPCGIVPYLNYWALLAYGTMGTGWFYIHTDILSLCPNRCYCSTITSVRGQAVHCPTSLSRLSEQHHLT